MDTKALVTLCQKGNGQALSLLYENYSEKMLKVCLRYIPDPTIAQDLLHDGFVIIFTSIHSLRNPEKLEYWMKKIMRNLALQYLNHANANPTIPLTDIPEEEEPAENPFCPDFISYDKMLDIVESLPEGYCKVFKLAVLEGLSHKEIGDLLGIAPHSSSSQLFRAKILLKKMLAGYRAFLVYCFSFQRCMTICTERKRVSGKTVCPKFLPGKPGVRNKQRKPILPEPTNNAIPKKI